MRNASPAREVSASPFHTWNRGTSKTTYPVNGKAGIPTRVISLPAPFFPWPQNASQFWILSSVNLGAWAQWSLRSFQVLRFPSHAKLLIEMRPGAGPAGSELCQETCSETWQKRRVRLARLSAINPSSLGFVDLDSLGWIKFDQGEGWTQGQESQTTLWTGWMGWSYPVSSRRPELSSQPRCLVGWRCYGGCGLGRRHQPAQ